MAKQTKPNFQKYQYGALAGRFLASKENARFAPSALEILAGSKGLNLGEEALGFVKGTQASPKGVETAIGVYAEKFQEKREKYTPAELTGWYAPVLKGLDKKDTDKILAALNEHDETIEAITNAYEDAQTIINASDRLYKPEQKAGAKKVMEKYDKVLGVMQTLDNYKFETLRGDAVDETRKKDLKDLASKL